MLNNARSFMIEVFATCIGAFRGMKLYLKDKRERMRLREKELFG
ncbi:MULTISPECIES: hypothetical protein [Bacillota]|nr:MULTISPECIES: hypothetical protein [Bacillota]